MIKYYELGRTYLDCDQGDYLTILDWYDEGESYVVQLNTIDENGNLIPYDDVVYTISELECKRLAE